MIYSGKFLVTSPFGYRTLNGAQDYHCGIDVVGVDSKEIRAVRGGNVVSSQIITDKTNRTWEWGNYVCIIGDDGMYYYYCHMSRRCASKGQTVAAGDIIGIEGNTGYSFGSHCHFEVRRSNGTSINPAPYLGIPNTIGEYPKKETETKEEDMDSTTFKKLFEEMRQNLKDNDCSEYSEKARAWATETGLVQGSGEIGGEPNYMWQDFLTREQLVTVLYRFMMMQE